jgi:hypothetical protein
MLISGASWRISNSTNAAMMTRPIRNSPSVLSEVQPQSLAFETAISSALRPSVRMPAPA